MVVEGSDDPAAVAAGTVLAGSTPVERRRRLAGVPSGMLPGVSRALLARAYAVLRVEPAQAVEAATLAGEAARRADDPAQALACASAVAQATLVWGKFAEAAAQAEAALAAPALAAAPESVRRELEGVRVEALLHLERYEEARDAGLGLLARADADGDLRGRIWSRMTLADLAFRLDDPREALARLREVDALLPATARPSLRGAVEANRANALHGVNRFQAAARHYGRARDCFATAGEAHGVAQTDYNAAYADSLRGRYRDALLGYERVEAEFRRLGDERHLAHIDLDRAEIHLHLHLAGEARTLARRARERFRSQGLAKEAALAGVVAGRASRLEREHAEAEADLADAAAAFAALGLAERAVGALAQRAAVALDRGDLARAAELTALARGALDERMNPLAAVGTDLVEARLALAERRPADALACAQRARRRQGHALAPWASIEADWAAARALVALAREEEALAAYGCAVETLERHRGGVPSDEYMTAYLAGHAGLYQELVDLLVRRGEAGLGFHYAERAKSRALVELLGDRGGAGGDGAAESPVARRVRGLRERLHAIYRRLARAEGEPGTRGTRAARRARYQAARLERDVGRLIREARLREREPLSLLAVSAPDLEAVQADLPEGTALVEYFLTGDALVTFVVRREAVTATRRPLAAADLRRMLDRFRFHLTRFERDVAAAPMDLALRATQANLESLAAAVLPPPAALEGVQRLVIVPHGMLHHAPFHALPLDGGVLLDRFEVVYAPSAAVYAYCRRERPSADGPAQVLALPDEQAPRIEEEARAVATRLGSRTVVHLQDEATFEHLRTACRDARLVHVATHGMFRPEQPMLSSIRLADRWMNLYDVYDLDVHADLVVLSTCESGIADVTDGDEILGLSRGFLYAGAPALLTSQWRVDDDAATEFMDAFYEALERHGDAAAAHRTATLAVRARRPHPYYWAPFFLTGRPSRRPAPAGGPPPLPPLPRRRASEADALLAR